MKAHLMDKCDVAVQKHELITFRDLPAVSQCVTHVPWAFCVQGLQKFMQEQSRKEQNFPVFSPTTNNIFFHESKF